MDKLVIPFNKPFVIGREIAYIENAIKSGKISGNGDYTKKCQSFFEKRYGFKKTLLTTSCTDALEMAALLVNIQPGDEVIVPSYTFVSTALAFVRQGAKIVFADSMDSNPNMDVDRLEALITDKTRAIVPVHYAGVACDMDGIMRLAEKYNLFVIEDAAQAIDSFYKGRPLGSIGHLGCFSFHETKNVICGEGGLLAINDESLIKRSEIIWEKGTNRAEFYRGEINKYGWVDIGSSFLPTELVSAYLYAQLENIDKIQVQRKKIWDTYFVRLKAWTEKVGVHLPHLPDYATNNAHMFYLLFPGIEERTSFISYLKSEGILAVFHYLSLHKSDFYSKSNVVPELKYADIYTDTLVRLPLYYDLTDTDMDHLIEVITRWSFK